MLTLRPTGLSSPAYLDWLDYVIVEDGRDVGRLYKDRLSRPEVRWFWSITVYVNPKLGITTKINLRTYGEETMDNPISPARRTLLKAGAATLATPVAAAIAQPAAAVGHQEAKS